MSISLVSTTITTLLNFGIVAVCQFPPLWPFTELYLDIFRFLSLLSRHIFTVNMHKNNRQQTLFVLRALFFSSVSLVKPPQRLFRSGSGVTFSTLRQLYVGHIYKWRLILSVDARHLTGGGFGGGSLLVNQLNWWASSIAAWWITGSLGGGLPL